MLTSWKLGLAALALALVAAAPLLLGDRQRVVAATGAPRAAAQIPAHLASSPGEATPEEPSSGAALRPAEAAAIRPEPRTRAPASGDSEEEESMSLLLRSALADREGLQEFWRYHRAPLMSEADRDAYRDLLSDPEMHEQVRQDLLQPDEKEHASQQNLQQLITVDYLRDALAWRDNPSHADLLEMITATLLTDNFEPGQDASTRHTIGTVKMELFETLYDHAPSRAAAVVEAARGTRLEALIEFIAQHVHRRRSAQVEVEKTPFRADD